MSLLRAVSEGCVTKGRQGPRHPIKPGAVGSELKHGSGDDASRKNLIEFYKTAIPADSVARAIAYAIEQPADVGINDWLRPLTQEFCTMLNKGQPKLGCFFLHRHHLDE